VFLLGPGGEGTWRSGGGAREVGRSGSKRVFAAVLQNPKSQRREGRSNKDRGRGKRQNTGGGEVRHCPAGGPNKNKLKIEGGVGEGKKKKEKKNKKRNLHRPENIYDTNNKGKRKTCQQKRGRKRCTRPLISSVHACAYGEQATEKEEKGKKRKRGGRH